MLNWEKCHFMVNQGIVLGHVISEKGIEVDKEKIELISKLPSPTNVKTVRQFLGHASIGGSYKTSQKFPSHVISFQKKMPSLSEMRNANKGLKSSRLT